MVATEGRVIRVRERQVRGRTYLRHGQQCDTWLPAGLWQLQGECEVTSDDGEDRVPAVILRRPVPLVQNGTWYVGPAALARL